MTSLVSHLDELSEFIEVGIEEKIASVTWLNHYSLATVMSSECTLEKFSLVGIDGIFLNLLSASKTPRTSADLFLPHFLRDRMVNVGIIGGPVDGIELREKEFTRRFPNVTCKFFLDGYSDWDSDLLLARINDLEVEVLIIGMGTPHQELEASKILERSEEIEQRLMLFTCGAWLEQLMYENYYPKWAYKLKLNWLVRLSRDPRKLWKRYFVESFKVLITRKNKVNYLRALPGFTHMQEFH